MNPSEYYQKLVATINDFDLRKCARIMSNHVGEENAIGLGALTEKMYGVDEEFHVRENDMRKTRNLLETLIEDHGYPVCSRSGVAGRWMPAVKEEGIKAAEERERRAEKLLKSAKQIRANVDRLPAPLPRIGAPDIQPRLI